MGKVYFCSRSSEAREDAVNYYIIHDDERIALNPIYIQRALELFKALTPGVNIISRSPNISVILEAAKIHYEQDYD